MRGGGAMTSACRHGHPRAEHSYRGPNGKQRCRACARASQKARGARARERFRAEHAGHDLRAHGQPTIGLVCLTCRYTDIDDAIIRQIGAGFAPTCISPSDRRTAIVTLATKGSSKARIARALEISVRTVERHLAAAREAA